MTQANAFATTGVSGEVIATHVPGDGKEYQVVVVAGSDGHIKGTKNTYVVNYKLADATTTGHALSIAFTANQVRQIATLHHLAASTRRKTIKRIELHIAATAATILSVQLVRITTAPATGNGVANIIPHVSDHVASDAVAFALPTTLGTAAADQPLFMQEFNLPANTVIPAPGTNQPIVLFPPSGQPADDDLFEPVIRAGVLEGYAIRLQSTAAVTIKATARIIFTEE